MLIYDKMIKDLNQKPFLALLELLDLQGVKYSLTKNSLTDIGYDKRYKDGYHEIFKPTLEEAKDSDGVIYALENSSLLGLKKANEFYELEVEVKSALEVVKTPESKVSFDGFKGYVYRGSDDEVLDETEVSFPVGLKTYSGEKVFSNDGFSTLKASKEISLNLAGDILFDAFDNGCDFLITNDIRSFYMFDKMQKDIVKVKNRDFGKGLAIFSVAEVLLLSLGKSVSEHAIKPEFID